jgi:hypothetical protein
MAITPLSDAAAAASATVIHTERSVEGSVLLRQIPRRVADGGAERAAYGRRMSSVTYHHPSRRELLGTLFARLDRVQAASSTLKSLAESRDATAATLGDSLEALQRDLLLAVREAESVEARITR